MQFARPWGAIAAATTGLLLAAGAARAAGPGGEPAVQQRLRQADSLLEVAPRLALQVAQQALAQAQRARDRPQELRCWGLMATACAFANDAAGALRYDYRKLALARQLGDSATAAYTYNNLASTLIDRRDTAAAAAALRQGFKLAPRGPAGDEARGTLLNSVAAMHYNEGRYGRAILDAREALRLLGPRPDSSSRWVVSALRGLLAACYTGLRQPARAEALLRETLAQDRRAGDGRQVAQNLVSLAGSLLNRNQPAGLDTLHAALGLARRLDLPQRKLECYEEFRNYYSRHGQYRQAFEWSQHVRELSDSLNDRQHRLALVAANAYYAAEARERQIATLHERTRLQRTVADHLRSHNQWLLAAVAALALGLVGAVWFTWKLRSQDQLLARQNAALARATAEAERRAEAQNRLYALVAHDLRGPIASFTGVSQLIEVYLQQQDGAGLAQVNALVRQTARNLNELLHNLLGWSLSQTGELKFAPQMLPLAPLLSEVAHFFATTAQARRVALATVLPPVGLRAWADPNLLKTVLRNLVGNALRYAPEGGRVSVHADVETDPDGRETVVLVVADNGSGMSPEQVQAVLGAGTGAVPVPPRHGDARAGTGLGLVLCLAFVRQHGGQFDIASEPGRGTRVRVALPVPPEAGPAVVPPAPPLPAGAALPRRRPVRP